MEAELNETHPWEQTPRTTRISIKDELAFRTAVSLCCQVSAQGVLVPFSLSFKKYGWSSITLCIAVYVAKSRPAGQLLTHGTSGTSAPLL